MTKPRLGTSRSDPVRYAVENLVLIDVQPRRDNATLEKRASTERPKVQAKKKIRQAFGIDIASRPFRSLGVDRNPGLGSQILKKGRTTDGRTSRRRNVCRYHIVLKMRGSGLTESCAPKPTCGTKSICCCECISEIRRNERGTMRTFL